MRLQGKRIVIPIAGHCDENELIYSYYRLKEESADVVPRVAIANIGLL